MNTRNLHRIFGVTILMVAIFALTGCVQPVSPTDEARLSDGGSVTGSMEMNLTIPNYRFIAPHDAVSDAIGAAAIAPQTAQVTIVADNGTNPRYERTLDISQGTSEPAVVNGEAKPVTYSWASTINGIPTGTYAAGDITVTLKDSQGAALTEGSNSESVSITTASDTVPTITLFTVPVTAPVLTDGFSVTVDLADSTMVFYTLNAVSGENYKAALSVAANPVDIAFFNSSGAIVAYETVTTNTHQIFTNTVGSAGTYYYGVFSKDGATTVDLSFNVYTTADAGPIALDVEYPAEPTWAASAYSFYDTLGGMPYMDAIERTPGEYEYLMDDMNNGATPVSYPGGIEVEILVVLDDPNLDPTGGIPVASGEPVAYTTALIAGEQQISAGASAFDRYLDSNGIAFASEISDAAVDDWYISRIEEDQRLTIEDSGDQATSSSYTGNVQVSVYREDLTPISGAQDVTSSYTDPLEFQSLPAADDPNQFVYIRVESESGSTGTYSIKLENLGTIAGQPIDSGDGTSDYTLSELTSISPTVGTDPSFGTDPYPAYPAVASDGTFYLAYLDNPTAVGDSDTEFTLNLVSSSNSGISWSDVTADVTADLTLLQTDGFADVQMDLEVADNVPYIAYQEADTTQNVHAWTVSGGSWQSVGPVDGGGLRLESSSLDMASSGSDLYLAVDDSGTTTVYQYNGSPQDWTNLGTPSSNPTKWPQMTVDLSGNPILLVTEETVAADTLVAYRYSAGSWQQVAGIIETDDFWAAGSGLEDQNYAVALDPAGNIAVSYSYSTSDFSPQETRLVVAENGMWVDRTAGLSSTIVDEAYEGYWEFSMASSDGVLGWMGRSDSYSYNCELAVSVYDDTGEWTNVVTPVDNGYQAAYPRVAAEFVDAGYGLFLLSFYDRGSGSFRLFTSGQ